MSAFLRRFGFAGAVVAAIAAMAVIVAGKEILERQQSANGPGGPPGAQGALPEVQAASVVRHRFSDAIQALGTTQARESIVITPKVADTIRRIRFDSGDRVRAGQVLVEMASVEQQADMAEARAANAAAQQELQRFRTLFDQGFASRARLDQVQAAADAAEARMNAGGSRISDRAIRAPFAGVIGLRTASPGAYVRPGDSIGTLDDISTIKLDFDVPEVHLSQLRQGVAIIARTPAFAGETFSGRIEQVDSRVATDTRSIRVRAILPNSDGRLRPGMLMTVSINSNQRDALAIPETAIVDRADGPRVFALPSGAGEPAVVERRIETGVRAGGFAEVTSGLAEGERVVVEGVQRVRPGQHVRVAGAAAPRAADSGAPR